MRSGVEGRLDGVVIGVLLGFGERGEPLVVFPGNPREEAVAARSTAALAADDVGGEVALLFEGGDPARPLVIGRLLRPAEEPALRSVRRAATGGRGGARRRRAAGAAGRAGDRAPLRQGDHHLDTGRQGADPRRLHLELVERREPDQGRLGAPELMPPPPAAVPFRDRPVLEHIVEQHAEEAAFLWTLRDAATDAPHYKRHHLARLDERVEAHVDGLRVAGEAGWRIALEQLERRCEKGELFAAGVLALESGDMRRIEPLVARAEAEPEARRGFVGAIAWCRPAAAGADGAALGPLGRGFRALPRAVRLFGPPRRCWPEARRSHRGRRCARAGARPAARRRARAGSSCSRPALPISTTSAEAGLLGRLVGRAAGRPRARAAGARKAGARAAARSLDRA